MFVICNENTRFPIKIWLEQESQLEESCLKQAYHLATLPFLHKWVCLMPDTHTGKGMPIGGVIATKDVIIPNSVGVDIGCGMDFIPTNIRMEDIRDIKTGNGSIICGHRRNHAGSSPEYRKIPAAAGVRGTGQSKAGDG